MVRLRTNKCNLAYMVTYTWHIYSYIHVYTHTHTHTHVLYFLIVSCAAPGPGIASSLKHSTLPLNSLYLQIATFLPHRLGTVLPFKTQMDKVTHFCDGSLIHTCKAASSPWCHCHLGTELFLSHSNAKWCICLFLTPAGEYHKDQRPSHNHLA